MDSPPMGITEAKAMAQAELEIGDDHVARARDEADKAYQHAVELSDRAIEGGKDAPAATEVLAAHADADHLRQRAERVSQRAERAAAARRLLALADVGKQVEQIHAGASKPGEAMVKGMRMIADGAALVRQGAASHNDSVKAVISRARELGAEPPAPNGPRASSAHIAARQHQIQSGFTIVRTVDKATVDDAVELAVKGDTEAAVRKLSAAHTVAPPKQADHYYLSANGRIHEGYDDGSVWQQMNLKNVAKGEMRELDPDETAFYLSHGTLDGYHDQT